MATYRYCDPNMGCKDHEMQDIANAAPNMLVGAVAISADCQAGN